jgi:hypothetical protein
MERELSHGVQRMESALGKLDTRNLSKKLRNEVKEMRGELEGLSKVDIKIDDNFEHVAARVRAVKAQLDDLSKRSRVVLEMTGAPQVRRTIREVEAAIDRIDGTIELDVDTKQVERKMGAFERSIKATMTKAARNIDGTVNPALDRLKHELEYLSRLRVGIDIGGAQIKRETEEIMAELDRLSKSDPDIDVRFEAARAWAELHAWNQAVNKADRQRIDVEVDVDTARARAQIAGLDRNGADAANTFRSFNGILLAATSIGPALVPILGGIAGGLLAIGPAAAVAGAGLGAVIIGFTGIGDAVQALQAQQDQAAMTSQTAARTEISNAKAIADARRAAADQIEAALKRQQDAQESYAKSIEDVKEAEQALRDAREAAKGTGEDLKDQIRDNQLAQDQGLLDVFNATVAYNSTMADGSATNAEKEQARINMESAQNALHELREEGKQLAADQKKWRKEGVNGTDEVKSAQDRLNDALDAQKDAYENLRDAAEAVDEARADGARNVRDAIQQQAAAMDDLNAQQNKVNAAFDKLGPAGQEFALFIQGLKDDFYDLRDAIQEVMLPRIQDALMSFLDSKAGSVLRDALINLADGFGRFVQALSQSFQGEAWTEFFQMLADTGPKIQAAYGGAFIKFLEAMASIMTTLAPFALEFAEGFERMMGAFADWAASKEGQQALTDFMEWAKGVGPDVLDFLGSFVHLAVAIVKALAPWGDIVLKGLTGFMDVLAALDPQFLAALTTAFIVLIAASQAAYGIESLIFALGALSALSIGPWILAGGVLLAIFAALYVKNKEFRDFVKGAWASISKAIKQAWNDSIKPALDDLMAALTDLWKKVLAPFFKWLGPLIVWLATKIIPLLAKWWAIEIRAIAWMIEKIWIPLILAMVDIVKWTWDNVLKPTWDAIAAAAQWLWHNVLSPVFSAIATAWHATVTGIKWAWNKILHPVFSALAKIVRVLWKATLKVIFIAIREGWKLLARGMKWTWEHILRPVWHAIQAAAGWLWREALKPVFDNIAEGWDTLMRGMKWVWDHVLHPVFSWIVDHTLPGLETAFQNTVDAIETIWGGLKRVVGAPIKFVLDTIINKGLIAGFNKVAGWVGEDGFDPIQIPKALQSYKTGGVMPGYTPGRDPHKFVSPTGGRLELSGGEAVMRPEWTAAMGVGYVNQMNAIARGQGVTGIKRAMGMAYSLGGVLPGASIRQHTSGYSNYAADMNWGSAYDDYGRPIHAYAKGFARAFDYGYDNSYGRGVVLDHGSYQTLYAHMSKIATSILGKMVSEGTTIGYVGDYGNTGTPPTSHLHFEIGSGWNLPWTSAPGASDGNYGDPGGGGGHKSIPGFIKDVLLHPMDTIKGWASSTFGKASSFVQDSPVFDYVKNVPGTLAGAMRDKVWDVVPGWAKSAVGVAGKIGDKLGDIADGAGHLASGALDHVGLATGGILPYNGTMKYDAGGYLPPGLTSVVNLTGKPEPVFTDGQWSEMGGASGQGGSIHYEPHFEGTNLTSEDVASDLNFTFRRMRRQGKYATVGEQ